jgi:hypothetical protein
MDEIINYFKNANALEFILGLLAAVILVLIVRWVLELINDSENDL